MMQLQRVVRCAMCKGKSVGTSRSVTCLSELHKKVPCSDESIWWSSVAKYLELNSNACGICCMSCHTQSMYCKKMGAHSSSLGKCVPRSSGATMPHRRPNWWPNESHSLMTNRLNPSIVRKLGSSISWARHETCEWGCAEAACGCRGQNAQQKAKASRTRAAQCAGSR